MVLSLLGAVPAHAQKVLVFSKTAGFRHDSIPQGIAAVQAIGQANGFAVDTTEDAAQFTTANLAQYDAVVWLSTTGDVLNEGQQAAFESYIRAGGGYVGVHAAADTEYDWPWYGELVGAYFNSHPANQNARVEVVDRAHPSTSHLPASWTRYDEWYNYRESPSAKVHVLATLDETSYSPGSGAMGADHPIAWCRTFDGGRTWYTGMGHTQESYADPDFRQHLAGGIRWAAGLTAGDCSVDEPEPCEATSDEFDGTALGCQWSIVRSTNEHVVAGGKLTVPTRDGDLYGPGGDAPNLFLQPAPAGAWEATTLVTIDARAGSQQAGLILYQNDDNYIKAVLLARSSSEKFMEIVQEINGSPRYDAAQDRLNIPADWPTTFYVRLTQVDGTVTASASRDGQSWQQIGRTATASSFPSPRVGLTAVTNDAAQVTEASFDFFRIQGTTPGEDTSPPSVTATPDGIPTATGAFLNHALVKLDATDLGSGVDTVEYALGDGPFTAYTGPVKVTSTGTVRYRATDKAGNSSPVGSVDVTIAAAPECDPVTPEPGFQALYDGTIESLADWTMAGPGGFQPRAGECVIDAWGGMGLLWYSKQQLVSPYTIRAEWRIYSDDDNSGIFIGFPDPMDDPWNPVNQGYEIQIDPTDEPVRTTGAIYSFQAANPAAVAMAIKPHGQWNVMEVSVDDKLIVVRLNGVEINRYTSPHPERDPSAGFFGIQNDGAGRDVSYRSVQVQGGGLPTPTPTPTPTPDSDEVEGDVIGTVVPSKMAITLGNETASFPPFEPGVTQDYDTTFSAMVTTSVRDARLTAADATAESGKLANGDRELPRPLQIRATHADTQNTAFQPLGGRSNPVTLLTFPQFAASEPVQILVRQHVAETDRILAGTYRKTIRFTLTATQP